MKIPEYRLKATERDALMARPRLRERRRLVARFLGGTLPRQCPRTRSARYIGQLEAAALAQPLLDRATTLKLLRPIRMWERMKKIGWKLRRRRAGKR